MTQATQVLTDLQKWGSEAHASELAAVFRQHMNNQEVSPTKMLVNIGRITPGRGSLDGDGDDARQSGGGGGIAGALHRAGSSLMRLLRLTAVVTLGVAALIVGWRGYHQVVRRRRGAPGSGATGAAMRYDPLTSDVTDEWAEEEPDAAHGMEMQHTVTGYAPQEDVDSTVAGV